MLLFTCFGLLSYRLFRRISLLGFRLNHFLSPLSLIFVSFSLTCVVGQTITLFIIPEVRSLIQEQLGKQIAARKSSAGKDDVIEERKKMKNPIVGTALVFILFYISSIYLTSIYLSIYPSSLSRICVVGLFCFSCVGL
jgi:NADH:ubiquinone oxidoreductase subunit 3 (subunit A)